jgi:hypothetical protein
LTGAPHRIGPAIGLVVALALAIAIALAACGGPTPVSPSATAGPASLAPSNPARPTGPTSPTPPSAGLAASVPPSAVVPDPSLLELVPAAAAGATLTYDPATTAAVAADPSLARDVSALATGLARPVNAGPDDPNVAIVNAARLRDPGAAEDDWFRDWRDTYDEAACAQAGGVARHAQFPVGTLAVFVAGCANGAFTYHVRIADGAVVLSMTSIGSGDLGRRIVERLEP